MTSAKKIIKFPGIPAIQTRGAELSFLPAALEVTETPPSPIGRAIGVTIITLFAAALIWACLGNVDIVATATGKIIPTERTKLMQPFEIGVVRAIHVRDGQRVKAGDVLIDLDPTMTEAELGHLKSDLISAKLDVARLRAALAGHADPTLDFNPPVEADQRSIDTQRQYLISQTAEYNAKQAELNRQIAQKQAERETTASTIEKIQAAIPLLQQRVDIRQYLFEKALGSKLLYLAELQDLTNQQQEMKVQESHLRVAEAATAALEEARAKTSAEYQRALFDDLTKVEQKVGSLSQDVIKAEQRVKFQELSAPVDGVVQQLAVHTVGGVVTPAQVLAVVVPLDSPLEIEAMVSNRDAGFVRIGQEAEIKVDAFNFTRYGLRHGRVVSVSRDAITHEKSQERQLDKAQNQDTGSSEPKGQELVYAARVTLDRSDMQTEDRLVELSPGMAVTVEIKTGTRRIINYLLSPLIKYKQEALRER